MLLKQIPENLYYREPIQDQAKVRMRYLGTAGFVIEGAGRVLVLDPFITRPSLWTTATQKLKPNEALIQQVIPRADDVLIGHSHHDHILDAPSLCLKTGARLIGSPDACMVGRAAGLRHDQLVETKGHKPIRSGSATLCGLPSLHGKVYFGRIPLAGNIEAPPPWPPRYTDLRHGLVLNWHIEIAGVRIVHIDTADFIDKELENYKADILCLCAIGRKYRPNYVKTAIEMLQPRYVIPCHWDWFFTHYHQPPRCLPGVDIPGMLNEIKAEGAAPILLPFDGMFGL